MRKDALAITVSTLVMGSFGAFLRWLQNRNIFDPVTGLAARGAAVSIVYVVYSLLALIAVVGIAVLWLRRYEVSADPAEALVSAGTPSLALSLLCALVFAVGGLTRIFSAADSLYPNVQRIFGACAVLAGACFPLITRRGTPGPRTAGRIPSAYLTLFCCFWLVFTYLTNAQNPVVWAYAPEILAVVGCTLGFYSVAAWYFDAAKPQNACVFLQLGAFLCICTLPDRRSAGETAMFAAAAAMLLRMEYILIRNMKGEKGEGDGTF